MPKKTWIINKFEGGLNSYFNHKDIPANSSTLLKNLNVSSIGRLEPVGVEHEEFTKDIAPATPGYGLFSFSHDYSIWSGYDVRAAVPGYYEGGTYSFDNAGVTNIWLTAHENGLSSVKLATVNQDSYDVIADPVGLDIYITPIGNEDVESVISKATKIWVEKTGGGNFFWTGTFTDARMGEAQRDYLVLQDNRDILIYQFVENEWIRTIPLSTSGSTLKPVYHFAEGAFRINDANFANNNSDVGSYGIGQKKLAYVPYDEVLVTVGNRDAWSPRISNGNFEYTDSTNGEQTPQFWTFSNEVTLVAEFGNFSSVCDVPGSASNNVERGYVHTPCQVYNGESYFINFWVGYAAGSGAGSPSVKVGPCGFGDRSLNWNAATEGNNNGASILIEAFNQHPIGAGIDNGIGGQNILLRVDNINTGDMADANAETDFGIFIYAKEGTTVPSQSQIAVDDFRIIKIPSWVDFPTTLSGSTNNLLIYCGTMQDEGWTGWEEGGYDIDDVAVSHRKLVGTTVTASYTYQSFVVPADLPGVTGTDMEIFFQYGINAIDWGGSTDFDHGTIELEVTIRTGTYDGTILKTLLYYNRTGADLAHQSFGSGMYATGQESTVETDFEGAKDTDILNLDAGTYFFTAKAVLGQGPGTSRNKYIRLANVYVAPLSKNYSATPPIEQSSGWQVGNFLPDAPDSDLIFVTDEPGDIQHLVENNHWGSGGSRVLGSTCLKMVEHKDGLGTWEGGANVKYSVGVAYYDLNGQESHMTIKNNVISLISELDTSSLRTNVMLDVFTTAGVIHSKWVDLISQGLAGIRWYISEGQENDWSIVADVNFKDGILFPGFDYEKKRDFLRISPAGTFDGIIGPYSSDGGIMLKSKPTLLRENIIGLKGDDTSFYRYKTSVVHGRRLYIGNILEVDEDGNKLSIANDLVRKSRLGKYDTFPKNSYLDVGMGDGDSVIKLESYADKLFVFKRNTLYVVVESEGIEYVENTFIGRGLQNITQSSPTPYGIAWMNKAGCYLLGSGEVEILTLNKIDQDEWLSFIDPSGTGNLSTIPSIVYNKVLDQLFVTQSHSSTVLSDTMIYDFTTKSWTKMEGKLIQQDRTNFITNYFSSPIDHKGVLSFADDKFYSWNKSSAESSVSIITKCIDFGNSTSNKTIHKVYVTYKGGTNQWIAVTYARDGGSFIWFDSPSLITSASSATTVAIFTTPTGSKRCKSFQLRLSGTGASTFEVNDITIVYSEKVTQ